jgi:hypothetical protein
VSDQTREIIEYVTTVLRRGADLYAAGASARWDDDEWKAAFRKSTQQSTDGLAVLVTKMVDQVREKHG